MKFLVVLLATVGYSYGYLYWDHIYSGETELPKKQSNDLQKDGWNPVEGKPEETLNIKWYAKDSDPSLQVAFDKKGSLAGVRVAFQKDKVNKDFEGVYKSSGIFEEATFFGNQYYCSTFLFTGLKVLSGEGRRLTEGDEIAQEAYLKKEEGGKKEYKRLYRNACDNNKKVDFTEQGCQENHGLQFSLFKKDSTCESLKPFYLIFNLEEDKGELLGFGWLAFTNDETSVTRTINAATFKGLFTNAPACLATAAEKGLKTVEVWMVPPNDRTNIKCSEVEAGKFVEKRCEEKRSLRGEGGDI